MIVCICSNVSDKEIKAYLADGKCPRVEANAGMVCGCCVPFIEDIEKEMHDGHNTRIPVNLLNNEQNNRIPVNLLNDRGGEVI